MDEEKRAPSARNMLTAAQETKTTGVVFLYAVMVGGVLALIVAALIALRS